MTPSMMILCVIIEGGELDCRTWIRMTKEPAMANDTARRDEQGMTVKGEHHLHFGLATFDAANSRMLMAI